MKIKLITISALLLIITSAFAGATIDYFTARSYTGDIIRIEWKSNVESNLSHYVIERSPVGIESYTERGKKNAEGDNESYYFDDDASNKTSDIVFKYRLKAVDKNGWISYSKSVTVTASGLSDVKRTWGSIKAMFR